MKQKISYNTVLSALSIIYFIVFIAIFVLFWVFIDKPYDNVFFWIMFGLFCLGIIGIWGYIPASVDADEDYVDEERPFHTKKYRMADIKSASVADAETYHAYDKGVHFHGKYKNPVLITLKDGTQFIIGSENAPELVDYINSHAA